MTASRLMPVLLAAAAMLALGPVANADLTTPSAYGWEREDDGSAYFEWDFFFLSSGGNLPDVGMFPDPLPVGWSVPDVAETTGAAFLTSTGNMYSFTDVMEFEVSVPNAGDTSPSAATTVLLQVRTLGREIDYSTVLIDGQAPVEIVELFREDLEGDFGGGFVVGFIVERLFRWELAGNASEYTIEFRTAEPSVSLDRVSVDTFVHDAPCVGDIADDFGSPVPDSMVSFGDFLALLGLVGPCPGGIPGCMGDIADDFGSLAPDGQVSFGDFLALLGLVGPC